MTTKRFIETAIAIIGGFFGTAIVIIAIGEAVIPAARAAMGVP